MLGNSILESDVATPTGVHLPDRKAMRFSKSRIVQVVERIVRGLLWHHYKAKSGSEAVFEVYRNPTLDDSIVGFINTMTQLSWIGDDILRYRHSLVNGDVGGSIWYLQFYGYSEWLVIVSGNAAASSSDNSV